MNATAPLLEVSGLKKHFAIHGGFFGGVTGHVFGLPRQKITRNEALRLATYNAAYAAFWEHRIGSIEPGKLADITIVDGNPMDGYWNMLKTKIVLKGGKVVVDKRK